MQQTTQRTQEATHRPSNFALFFHAFKTLHLVYALLIDRRIPILRKAAFLLPIGFLLVLLIFPDALNEAFLSTVLPILGTILGIPIDAGFDWIALALAAMALLRLFPAEVMDEHYQRIFHHKQEVIY